MLTAAEDDLDFDLGVESLSPACLHPSLSCHSLRCTTTLVRMEKIPAKTAMSGEVITGCVPSRMRCDNKPTVSSSRVGVLHFASPWVKVIDDHFTVFVCSLILRNECFLLWEMKLFCST